MLYKIFIFVLFLGPLVFFHELGHFLFARLFGVRVEVFSLGFGPKLFRRKWGETEYALSLIPLGGYVKMFGDDPMKAMDLLPEERAYSFTHQSKWARFWIVFGGPLANFILAFVIFFFLTLTGEKVPQIRFGLMPLSSPLMELGILPGDRLVKVNQTEIFSPTDIPAEKESSVYEIQVKRQIKSGEQVLSFPMKLDMNDFFKMFTDHSPFLRTPVVYSPVKGKFYLLSLTPEIDPQFTISLDELAHFVHSQGREVSSPLYIFELPSFDTAMQEMPWKSFLKSVKDLKLTPQVLGPLGQNYYDATQSKAIYESFFQELALLQLWPLDLMAKSLKADSSADKAKMKPNDLIVAIESAPLVSFDQLRAKIQESEGEVEISVRRGSEILNLKMLPHTEEIEGQKLKLIGVFSFAHLLMPELMQMPGRSFIDSLVQGAKRSWEAMEKVAMGFKKLITNEVSLKNVGGPLSIGKVAADSFSLSLSYFFQLMALISVNLGVINLFPIPVLDGGHILFLFMEWVNRGPLSRRKMEIAQQFGLSILLFLMVAALFNDFTRFFS